MVSLDCASVQRVYFIWLSIGRRLTVREKRRKKEAYATTARNQERAKRKEDPEGEKVQWNRGSNESIYPITAAHLWQLVVRDRSWQHCKLPLRCHVADEVLALVLPEHE